MKDGILVLGFICVAFAAGLFAGRVSRACPPIQSAASGLALPAEAMSADCVVLWLTEMPRVPKGMNNVRPITTVHVYRRNGQFVVGR